LILTRYGMRLVSIFLVLAVGILAATVVGPAFETAFFSGDVDGEQKGDIVQWLNQHHPDEVAIAAAGSEEKATFGSGVGAWMLLLMPSCAFLMVILVAGYVNPMLRRNAHRWSRAQFGVINFAKFLLGLAAAFGLAWLLSMLLGAGAGIDLRGTFVDTYVQRNALVVGFVMGFAIIPIIYTIAEDALSTVPTHLRSASLGAGATPWQTAVRVVIPTAMSGLFSALMVGLGRAVGETMIVLMAAGNTPVMEWNIFNGFRTLSANIATELPEAVVNSTHYRTLFLCALVLFVLTFIVNTVAEVVRLRFRRRAYQL